SRMQFEAGRCGTLPEHPPPLRPHLLCRYDPFQRRPTANGLGRPDNPSTQPSAPRSQQHLGTILQGKPRLDRVQAPDFKSCLAQLRTQFARIAVQLVINRVVLGILSTQRGGNAFIDRVQYQPAGRLEDLSNLPIQTVSVAPLEMAYEAKAVHQ